MLSLLRYLLAACVIASVPTAAVAQSRGGLELTLRTSSPTVSLGQSFAVQALLRNTGATQRIVLRGKPQISAAQGIELTVVDASGLRSVVPVIQGGPASVPSSQSAYRTTLMPGEALGTHRWIKAADLFTQPGLYTLEASYVSPPPLASGSEPVSGEIEGAFATSQTLEIEVTE